MKIFGLTGPTGAGKTCACKIIETFGIPTINTDEIYHNLINKRTPCVDAVAGVFGDEVVTKDGALDRQKMADMVFSGDNAKTNKAILEKITHKYIMIEVKELIYKYEKEKKNAVVIDAPALLSSQIFLNICDTVISIVANEEIRTERVLQRDGIDIESAQKRISAQPENEYYISNSEYYIDNSIVDENRMKKQLKDIFTEEGLFI